MTSNRSGVQGAEQHDGGESHREEEDVEAMLDADEAGEVIAEDADGDVPMDSDPEEEGDVREQEIQLQNDSIAHFDRHSDSIFAIAQHPTQPQLVATGGGDDTGYLFDTSKIPASSTAPSGEREGVEPLLKLDGHKDSVNAVTFTLPSGQFLLTAGLDGQLRAYTYKPTAAGSSTPYKFFASAQEVEEINFLVPCPHPSHPDVVALGASDGSVWVYRLSSSSGAAALDIVQAYYMHTSSCTAGAWTPDGKLLATVAEDGSLYVWDVFGDAAAAGVASPAGSQSLVSLTPLDERFKIDGGLYSIAISPGGMLAAVGGAEGQIRIVGLPRLSGPDTSSGEGGGSATKGSKSGAGAASKAGVRGGAEGQAGTAGQAGSILASIQTQTDSIETLSFAARPVTLLAAGSVDGSIAVFDAGRGFAVRRVIPDAHDGDAVIKTDFITNSTAADDAWILTSCGNDGVVRRWDLRGATSTADHGRIGEWKGHRGGGEGGGILGFVQHELPGAAGKRVVTAGDDGVALVFDMTKIP